MRLVREGMQVATAEVLGLHPREHGCIWRKGGLQGRLNRWGSEREDNQKTVTEEHSTVLNVAKQVRKIKVRCVYIQKGSCS